MTIGVLARIVRAHWLVIFSAALMGAGLAFGWTLLQPTVYTSTGSVIVSTGAAETLAEALVAENYAAARVTSYLDVAKSRGLAEDVVDEMELDESPDTVLTRITVANPLDTAVLRISATGPSPEAARELTQGWITGLTAKVAELESGADGTGESIVALQTLDSGNLPSSPSSPNTKLMVAIGLVLGLAAGVAYSIIRASMDRHMRSADDVERAFSLPVIGALPYVGALAKSGPSRSVPDPLMNEAVRELRTNLQYMSVDDPPRVIVITSALPGDGKSTVSCKLAEALAQSDRKVVLIDADLRRPKLAANLGLSNDAGLTDVLVGRANVEDVLQPYGDTGNLQVMSAGPIPPNPSELIGSNALRTLLYSFPQHTTVLVDTPPLLPVTDAAILTVHTDGAVMVARAGRTTTDMLDRALRALERVNGRVLGIVLDAVPQHGPHRDVYAYGYGYTAKVADEFGPPAVSDSASADDDDDEVPAGPTDGKATGDEAEVAEERATDADEPAEDAHEAAEDADEAPEATEDGATVPTLAPDDDPDGDDLPALEELSQDADDGPEREKLGPALEQIAASLEDIDDEDKMPVRARSARAAKDA